MKMSVTEMPELAIEMVREALSRPELSHLTMGRWVRHDIRMKSIERENWTEYVLFMRITVTSITDGEIPIVVNGSIESNGKGRFTLAFSGPLAGKFLCAECYIGRTRIIIQEFKHR